MLLYTYTETTDENMTLDILLDVSITMGWWVVPNFAGTNTSEGVNIKIETYFYKYISYL